jgi:hypothetical protein
MQLHNAFAATPSEIADSDDDLLDTPEAAEFLGCSASKLNKKRVYGGIDAIPYVKDGRSVRYLRRDLRLYRDSRKRRSTSDTCATEIPAPAGA